MAVDVAAIRQGLADVVAATGLDMLPRQTANINPPCGWVELGDPFIVEPWEAFRDGLCQLSLIVRVVGSDAGGIEHGLANLDPYLGSGTGQTTSVIDAIHADTSLGGAISAGNIRILEVGGPQQIEALGGLQYIGFDVPLRIYVPRT